MLTKLSKIKFTNLFALFAIICLIISFARRYTKIESQINYDHQKILHIEQEMDNIDNVIQEIIFEIQIQNKSGKYYGRSYRNN